MATLPARSPTSGERNSDATAPASIDFSANPYRTILKLALPTVIAMLSQSVVNEIDLIFFRLLPAPEDSNAQAALMPCLILVWLFGGSISAVSVGTQALTARRIAEGDRDGASAVLTNSALFCLVAAPIATILAYVALPFVLHAQLAGGAFDIGNAYARWRLLGIFSMSMTFGLKGFFDGIGRTYVHFWAAVIMNVLNVLFCWMFIFGHLGAPRMGAPGAGLSALLSTWIGLFIMIGFTLATRRDFSFWRRGAVSRSLTWSILKLSIPAALATAVMMGGFQLLLWVVGRLDRLAPHPSGEAVNGAATNIIIGILKLTFTACIAFGTSTATLVAQALGAKRPDDAERFGWASVRLGVVIFGVVGLCEGVFFTSQIVNFVSDSEHVRAASMMPLRLMGIVTPILAVGMIISEALFGAGNPKFVAVVQFVLIFFVLLPLAYALALVANLGLIGVWAAACVYVACAATAMTLKFRAGAWKTIKL
jgi:putative MATE family efflux protein